MRYSPKGRMNLNPCRRHTTPIHYQLLALRCGQRPLVGNGFIRSACCGFVGSFRSGYRKKRIGISVDAPLNVFPLRSLRGRCRLRQMRCNYIRAVGATLFTYVSVLPVPKSIAVGNGFIRSVCTDFAGTKIHSRRGEHCSPGSIMWRLAPQI